jgi:hypothetical protein
VRARKVGLTRRSEGQRTAPEDTNVEESESRGAFEGRVQVAHRSCADRQDAGAP